MGMQSAKRLAVPFLRDEAPAADPATGQAAAAPSRHDKRRV